MSVIHKHVIQFNDPLEFYLMLPREAVILPPQVQCNSISLWFLLHNKFAPLSKRRFVWIETGEDFESKGKSYIGTVQLDGWVGHLFEIL
jgi:hypothetical protein